MNQNPLRPRSGDAMVRRWILWGAALATCVIPISFLYFLQPPDLPKDQMRHLQLLSTAVSSRSSQQVTRLGEFFKSQREAGKMTGPQWKEFQKILDCANRKEWDQAIARCERFKAAQVD
jgi:hypothetical protein